MTTPLGSAFVVYAQVRVGEAKREEFLTHILKLAARSLADETGCLQYDVIDLDRGTQLFGVYEVYRDAAAYDSHQASPHFHAWKVVAEVFIEENGLNVQTGRRVPQPPAQRTRPSHPLD